MPDQNIWVQLSIAYCMVHMYVLLLLLYEYRGSKKVFWCSATALFIVTSAVCLWIMVTRGIAAMGQYGVLIGSVPSLVFLFAFSRQRNAKFVFIFCLCDTVCMWVELASGLIDYAVGGGGVVTLLLRLAALPLLEYAVWRWLRRPFLEITHIVRHSWPLFAILTGVCYLILVILSVYPTVIFQRPQDIPLTVMVLVLIALAYTTLFLALFEQLHKLKTQERQRVFEAQTMIMYHRVEDMRQAEERIRIQRHDMRHQFQTIATLAQRGDLEALRDYIGTSQAMLDAAGPQPSRGSGHPSGDVHRPAGPAAGGRSGAFHRLCQRPGKRDSGGQGSAGGAAAHSLQKRDAPPFHHGNLQSLRGENCF